MPVLSSLAGTPGRPKAPLPSGHVRIAPHKVRSASGRSRAGLQRPRETIQGLFPRTWPESIGVKVLCLQTRPLTSMPQFLHSHPRFMDTLKSLGSFMYFLFSNYLFRHCSRCWRESRNKTLPSGSLQRLMPLFPHLLSGYYSTVDLLEL